MKDQTILQHLGEEEHHLGAVTPPIFQTSLFVQESVAAYKAKAAEETARPEGYVYSRVGNPNQTILERKLAALERTEECRVFGSGMAAISAAILSVVTPALRTGPKNIVAIDSCYGPTYSFMRDYLSDLGIEARFVRGIDPEDYRQATDENTILYYLESPSSIAFYLQDIPAITAMAKERGIITIHDNSYSAGWHQRPAEMGVDLIVHSGTKYLAGHSDLTSGVVCGAADRVNRLMAREGQWLGAALAPFPAWLMTRGVRTLALRMAEANRRGHHFSAWLRGRPEVAQLFSADQPTYLDPAEHARRFQGQMGGQMSSLMTILPVVQDRDRIWAFVDALELLQTGVSWGGFESPVVPLEIAQPDGSVRQYVRFYFGLEDIGDLEADLDQAFALIR